MRFEFKGGMREAHTILLKAAEDGKVAWRTLEMPALNRAPGLFHVIHHKLDKRAMCPCMV